MLTLGRHSLKQTSTGNQGKTSGWADIRAWGPSFVRLWHLVIGKGHQNRESSIQVHTAFMQATSDEITHLKVISSLHKVFSKL